MVPTKDLISLPFCQNSSATLGPALETTAPRGVPGSRQELRFSSQARTPGYEIILLSFFYETWRIKIRLLSCFRYRIFNIKEGGEDIESCGSIKETEMIYDYCWEGGEGSRFLSTGRYQPIHLWDPDHGELVATYKCFNHLDEITHSFSLCIISSGGKFLTGLKNQVRTFDLSRPGRVCDINVTGNKSGEGQVGIISSLCVNTDLNMYAAGSYSKTVGLYSLTGTSLCLLAGHSGGVTQVSTDTT